jgi:hypothetical protein
MTGFSYAPCSRTWNKHHIAMGESNWILVVEPKAHDQESIQSAGRVVAPHVQIVCVDGYQQFIAMLASRGSLPILTILDWSASGDPISCIDTLARLGFASRIPMVATARANAREALEQAYKIGVTRFISKYPDAGSFSKKIAEALCEFVPGARKLSTTETLHELW